MSNPFIQRVANWLAQEVVVKGLAENKTFQRFALRTDAHVKELTKKVPNPTEHAPRVRKVKPTDAASAFLQQQVAEGRVAWRRRGAAAP